MKFSKNLFFFLSFLFFVVNGFSQGMLSGKDLSTVSVDALSEVQINDIRAQLKKSGFSIEMVESQAIAKGMSPQEFAKLKDRVNNPITTAKTKQNQNPLNSNQTKKSLNKDSAYTYSNTEQNINPLIYGSELFNQNNGAFNVNKNLATPINYEVGPSDVLKLVLYGIQEFSSDLTVSKEGKIQIENVGEIKVAGLTIEAVTERVKIQMAKTAYPSLLTGESKISLTLGDVRTIHITVIGANKSGNYNVSSLSNVISVLSEAGGPNKIGSYRNIQIVRNNKVFKKVDLYQFMQFGDQSQNIGLKDNDIIIVPPFISQIEIQGEVKRPGIFELNNKETFSQLLQYAGGFNDNAYSSLVKIIQKNDKEKSIKDLSKKDFESYLPSGGDLIVVSKILERFRNRVTISGAVFRPDEYELTNGLKISDLISKADGLKEDAYIGRAQLVRLKPNLLKELISINLQKAIQKDKKEDIVLQREDELYINSILEIRDSLTVDLLGEVRNPGKFNYVDSMTVKDLILMAGGFTFAANKQVEVARLVNFENEVTNNQVTTILKTEINGDLSFNLGQENYVLQPLDVVTITKKVGYTLPEIVSISGQVQNNGKFTLTSRVERVSDIIKRAGGLIGEAYGEGAYIKRNRYNLDSLKSDESKTSIEQAYLRKFKAKQENDKQLLVTSNIDPKIQSKKLRDTLDLLFNDLNNDYYQIAIDINYIMKHPGSEVDLVLRDKDEIVIPKQDNRVKISGGVLRPTNIVYRDGLSIGECISSAGGISEYARRNRAYVVYANGKSNRTKSIGLFRFSPKIKPGCEVVIPETDVKKEKALTGILQFTTVLAQVASALATISILSK